MRAWFAQDFLRDHIEQSDPSQPSANPEYFLKNKLSVEKNLGSSVQTLNPTSESRFRLRSVDERAVGQVAGELGKCYEHLNTHLVFTFCCALCYGPGDLPSYVADFLV